MTVEDVLSAELEAEVVTIIRPGVAMLCPDGWSGLWEVDETVRKTYAAVKTDAYGSS